jgi:hypothetical protein
VALVTRGTRAGPAGRQIGMMQEEKALTQNGRMQSMVNSRLNEREAILATAGS